MNNKMNTLKVKLLDGCAMIPQKGSELAAGYDLFSNMDCVIGGQDKGLVKTGISIGIPHEHYARIAPRSGLAWKNFIDVGAGVIDEDYTGEIGVVLFNHSKTPFVVNKGDRVAQLIIEKILYAPIEVVQDLVHTDRGQGGFGSTGLNQISSNTNLNLNPSLLSTPQIINNKLKNLLHLGLITNQQSLIFQSSIQQVNQINISLDNILKSDDNQIILSEFDNINNNLIITKQQ